MAHQHILPEGWPVPKGYANGILADSGRLLFIAGQVGWDENEVFSSTDIVPQFERALKNILTIVSSAGGVASDICRMTCFCKDRDAYLLARKELGAVWKSVMGRHYPCMSMIFVSDLLDHPALIEIEATAVIPSGEVIAGQRTRS
ncbi:MAG: RidA family protein [Saprospiraceae bacterium]|jgi:enamine deaminase RidA (YjgF/YER057c/UK114 family)|nr:RidA family protein [Saprospiraceae bacterium]MBP9209738.1 RidA family protein [Saprospiraceae bacterium]